MHHYNHVLRQEPPFALRSPGALRLLAAALIALSAGGLLLFAVPSSILGWVLAAAMAGLLLQRAIERCGGGHARGGLRPVRQVVRDGGSLGAGPARASGGAVLRCLDGGSLERARY
jgi:hypothetical protein